MFRVIICLFFLFPSLLTLAQDRCGTVEYEKLRQLKRPSKETIDQFESWMKDKITQKQKAFQTGRLTSINYVVPIVVHVIHNGETIGSGTNISDAQINSQITVLNNDFQRLNADSVKTLSEFVSVAGKFKVNFVLAKQDQNGLATSGIVRVKGSKTSWNVSDNYALKAESYWPAEDYLNIWIVSLGGGLLGYTQFPVSSTLQGLEDASSDRLTDGVVIDYQAFGTVQDPNGSNFNLLAGYNLGRTVTHEVGHFFGLRHVWGDVNSCNPAISTDYVSDTPIQDKDFNGTCPSSAQSDCNVSAMFSNYMNYTDDACMNIFSKGQVSRMDIALNNSPRRASLLTSLGSQVPAPVADDIQLKALVTPGAMACSGSVSPSLLLHNFGSNSITSTQIQFSLDGNIVETKIFPSLSLAINSETIVNFSPVLLNAGSSYKFSFQVLKTNSLTDGRFYNDTLSLIAKVAMPVTLPMIEPFNQTPANWSIVNPDGQKTWANTAVGTTKAMYVNFYDDQDQGTSDWLITPELDLTSATTASISFDYAYAVLSGSSDRLKVIVSTSCDFNSSPVEIFNKAGSNLNTTSKKYNSAFSPLPSEWITKIILLDQFIGQKIRIAFVGVNDYGNNLYIDNVTVLNYPVSAFAINNLISPSPVSCLTSAAPVLSIKNLGNTVIDSFTADIYINNQLTVEQVSNAQIDIGTSKNITFLSANFLNGSNTVSVVIKSPNGVLSGGSTKDSLATKRFVSSAKDVIPLRQDFNTNFPTSWTTMSPNYGSIWRPAETNADNKFSIIYDAFGSGDANIGKQAWLVSPILDFSNAQKASVFFETSYAYNSPKAETLQVFYSTDCGQNFNQQVFSSSGTDLENVVSSSSWVPFQDADWTKQYINLDAVAGQKNVRLAFVATNDNGNNLYIDNVEFFAGDNQSPVSIDSDYSVYGGLGSPVKVTFNLPERQLVRLQIYDMMGHAISDQMLPDTLNQTYTLESSDHPKGIYIVRIQTQSSVSSTKVYFGF
jgi:hypothetical protein